MPGRGGPREKNHLGRWALISFVGLIAASWILCSCDYEILITAYDPDKAFNGLTCFYPYLNNLFQVADMEGRIVLEFEAPDMRMDGDFEILWDGRVLIMGEGAIFLYRPSGTAEWAVSAPLCHHCVIPMPNGHIMYIFGYYLAVEGWDLPFLADGIREVDPSTGDTVWEWKTSDHLSTGDYCPLHIQGYLLTTKHYDWTHSNTIVFREAESAVYLNSRHLDRIVKIDYPSGEILWSMGAGGDFGEGLFSHAHDPQFLENDNILIFDNGNHIFPVEFSRAVEIAFDPELGWAEEVWAWPTEPLFFDPYMGDANRLPNGNTLITSSLHGSLFEVTQSGEVVWNLIFKPHDTHFRPMLYKAERISTRNRSFH